MERLSENKPLQDQLNKLQDHLKELKDGSLALANNMQALLVLSKIPKSYCTLVSGLLSLTDLTNLTVDMVVRKTIAEENVQKTEATGSSATRVSTTKPKKKGPCGHCGGKGHDESSCWKKYPDKKLKKGVLNLVGQRPTQQVATLLGMLLHTHLERVVDCVEACKAMRGSED